MAEINELQFYGVRNKEGKWFRAKGYGGYGETWVKELKKARIYNRIGPARAQVSYFSNEYPEYGIPDIILFKCTELVVLDETERVLKQKKSKEFAEKKREMINRKRDLEEAQRQFEQSQKRLKELKNKNPNLTDDVLTNLQKAGVL